VNTPTHALLGMAVFGLRIPTMSAGHSEPKSATCSDPSRPAVPIDVGRGGGSPAGRW